GIEDAYWVLGSVLPVWTGEVQYSDVVSRGEQRIDNVRADEAGAACNSNSHLSFQPAPAARAVNSLLPPGSRPRIGLLPASSLRKRGGRRGWRISPRPAAGVRRRIPGIQVEGGTAPRTLRR